MTAPPTTPFFITGTGRSGSTYLYHLLRDHPRIALTNEARVLDALWLAYQVVATPYGEKVPDSELVGLAHPSTKPLLGDVFCCHLLPIMEEYYRRRFKTAFTHYGDKLPDHCAVGIAAQTSPEVRVLMMVRDPRDVVCSYRSSRRHTKNPGPREIRMHDFSASDFAVIWRDTYAYLLRAVPKIHRVIYAELCARPAETAAAALRHLGLEPDSSVAEAIRTNRTLAEHGTSESAALSIGRWKRDLDPADARIVAEVCGPMMRELDLEV